MQKLDDRYDIPGLSESDCDWLAHLLGTRRPVLQPIVTEFGRQAPRSPYARPPRRRELADWLMLPFEALAVVALGMLLLAILMAKGAYRAWARIWEGGR